MLRFCDRGDERRLPGPSARDQRDQARRVRPVIGDSTRLRLIMFAAMRTPAPLLQPRRPGARHQRTPAIMLRLGVIVHVRVLGALMVPSGNLQRRRQDRSYECAVIAWSQRAEQTEGAGLAVIACIVRVHDAAAGLAGVVEFPGSSRTTVPDRRRTDQIDGIMAARRSRRFEPVRHRRGSVMPGGSPYRPCRAED